MNIGSILTLGYGPAEKLRSIPTIGYFVGAADAAARRQIIGPDAQHDDEDYIDRRLLKRRKEEVEVIAVIKRFLGVLH